MEHGIIAVRVHDPDHLYIVDLNVYLPFSPNLALFHVPRDLKGHCRVIFRPKGTHRYPPKAWRA